MSDTSDMSNQSKNNQQKPRLSFWQIWNVSFGFLGVQFGFALQNANASRILSDLGADLHSLSLFWAHCLLVCGVRLDAENVTLAQLPSLP